MLTGFEALGAASAVLQVISLAGTMASQCYRIYEGRLTPEDQLEEHAFQMMDAARRAKIRHRAMHPETEDEKKLAEIAQKCIEAAEELQKETHLVTSLCQKGKLSKALHATFRSGKHKSKIGSLEKRLDGYKQVMETQLMLKLCTKHDALQRQQDKHFDGLEKDVQDLISRIAKGCTKIEDLIKTEQDSTRNAIAREAKTTRQEVNLVASEVQALGIRQDRDKQRERLVKSLKVHEMNERYQAVMDPGDASFERVFASYERVAGQDASNHMSLYHKRADKVEEIDEKWGHFISWLRSSTDEMFWIRGKPGSGKSTLIKFVINHNNTKRLLEQSTPGTKILSHFFWKIGSRPQNSIKGLLCTLLHGALGSDGLVDAVLNHFGASSSKDSYHDWSERELEEVLFFVLQMEDSPFCVFIDGLDEISNEERFSKLMDLTQKVNGYRNVKVCVSSRPETQLIERFEAMGAQMIRLEDLTRPEMRVYVGKQFGEFHANEQISSLVLENLTDLLLTKAEGVFLWLFIATRSLVGGLQNHDNEETLIQRLEQMPAELESLYADMWTRLNANNSVYREAAGRYFRYAIAGRGPMWARQKNNEGSWCHMGNLTLIEVAIADRLQGVDSRDILPARFADEGGPAKLKQMCEVTQNNIGTRCAGLLQLLPSDWESNRGPMDVRLGDLEYCIQQVAFIHRTAHDFLVDTEAGQRILNFKHDAALSTDTDIRLFRGSMCMASMLFKGFGFVADIESAIKSLAALACKRGHQAAMSVVPLLESLYKQLILTRAPGPPRWFPQLPLLSLMSLRLASSEFNHLVLSLLRGAESESANTATNVLRDLVATTACRRSAMLDPASSLIRGIISLGADPHARGVPLTYFPGLKTKTCTQQLTAFGLLLLGSFNHFKETVIPIAQPFLDAIGTMAPTCPDWHTQMLVTVRFSSSLFERCLSPAAWTDMDRFDWDYDNHNFCYLLEVDLQFLLTRILSMADSSPGLNPEGSHSELRKLADGFAEPFVRLRCLIYSSAGVVRGWYRVLDQDSFRETVAEVFSRQLTEREKEFDELMPGYLRVEKVLEKVDRVTEIDRILQDDVGVCRWEDVGIFPPANEEEYMDT